MLGIGWFVCRRLDVPLAGKAIVEFDDLVSGENDEPGLCELRDWAELQSRMASG
jgi:hypothetical protein